MNDVWMSLIAACTTVALAWLRCRCRSAGRVADGSAPADDVPAEPEGLAKP